MRWTRIKTFVNLHLAFAKESTLRITVTVWEIKHSAERHISNICKGQEAEGIGGPIIPWRTKNKQKHAFRSKQNSAKKNL